LQETKFDVNLYTAADVNIDEVWDALQYSETQLNEPAHGNLPMGVFESPPVYGKKPVAISCEVHDEHTVSLVYCNTYAFLDRFNAAGISGGRINATETSKGDYVRFQRNVDLSDEAQVKSVTEDVFKTVLKNVACGP